MHTTRPHTNKYFSHLTDTSNNHNDPRHQRHIMRFTQHKPTNYHRDCPYTFTPTGTPPKGKVRIHTIYSYTPPTHINNNLTNLIVNTNFIGTLHISYKHLKQSKCKTIHGYMCNLFIVVLLARDILPKPIPTYPILKQNIKNMPTKTFSILPRKLHNIKTWICHTIQQSLYSLIWDFFWHFETITNIRTWIKSNNIGECCKMRILWSGCSYQEPN